jgi:hypothetical protein
MIGLFRIVPRKKCADLYWAADTISSLLQAYASRIQAQIVDTNSGFAEFNGFSKPLWIDLGWCLLLKLWHKIYSHYRAVLRHRRLITPYFGISNANSNFAQPHARYEQGNRSESEPREAARLNGMATSGTSSATNASRNWTSREANGIGQKGYWSNTYLGW